MVFSADKVSGSRTLCQPRVLTRQQDSRKEMTIHCLSQQGLSGLSSFIAVQDKNFHTSWSVPAGRAEEALDLKRLHGRNGADVAAAWTDG